MTKIYKKTKYEYYDPKEECCHPQRLVKEVDVIYEEESIGAESQSFSVAYLKNGKSENKSIGIRWNIASDQYKDEKCAKGEHICLGFPYSHKYPTWFVLPSGTKWDKQKNVLIIPLNNKE